MNIYFLDVKVDGFCAEAVVGWCRYKFTAKSDEAAQKYAKEKVEQLHNPSGSWFKKREVQQVILKKEVTLTDLSSSIIITTNNPIIEWMKEVG